MLKQEKINIADTNMALFGTDLEKEIKKHAANGEPAWKTAGKQPGLEIWRVEKFKIVPWPKDQYGKFYSGDSYIILYTYKDKERDCLKYDVHFWLGKYTTLDEAGTAAYKTVELDDYLNGLPVQYREVQDYESQKFLDLFDNAITVMDGGVESGFKHVEPEKYRPRLLQIKGKINKTVVREVYASVDSLNQGDVFILDCGLKLYVFTGQKAGMGEKAKSAQLTRAIDDERGSKVEIHNFGWNDKDEHANFFWQYLGGKPAQIKSAEEGGSDDKLDAQKRLFKVSDASGSLKFTEVPFKRSNLDTNDVFVADVVSQVFVWIGKNASPQERRSGVQLAQSYLNDQPSRNQTPIVRILEGGENEEFHTYFE